MEGHGELCFFCGLPCSDVAADPGQWPLGFAHPDGTGIVKWHHTSCVVQRLFPQPEYRDERDDPANINYAVARGEHVER